VLIIVDDKGRELERYSVPLGAVLPLADGSRVKTGDVLASWDPHSIPIFADRNGRVRFEDIVEGKTMKREVDAAGIERKFIVEHKGDLHPQIVIEDDSGTPLIYYPIPEKAYIEVEDKMKVKAGTLLAKTPRESEGTQDITGGLPRVTEIFEARRPKEPAIMAEIDGIVELVREMKRGKRTILVKNEESGITQEHLVPHGKHLKVQSGDRVRAGQPLIEGPLIPHDILRINGEEALQGYLLREVQGVYRSQNVSIDDKHIEVIVSQMLRKVQVGDPGDSDFLPDAVVDKFRFRRSNQEMVKAEEAAGHGRAGAARHHQGRAAERLDDLGRLLPGDDQGADRGRDRRAARHARRPEGERDPRQHGADGHGLPAAAAHARGAQGRGARSRRSRCRTCRRWRSWRRVCKAAAASGVGSGPLIRPVRTFREVTASTEHGAHRQACADPRARRGLAAPPSAASPRELRRQHRRACDPGGAEPASTRKCGERRGRVRSVKRTARKSV
jgi:hypothetical protein